MTTYQVCLAVAGLFLVAQSLPATETNRHDSSLVANASERTAHTPALAAGSTERLREGMRIIDRTGRFEFAGDRVAFFPSDSKESFRVLENLALERISRAITESRVKADWIISGTLTEFHGVNYLLVTKAVMKSAH